MTTLTKFAIVFHVVLSLMLTAGLIVFVNRTESFKTTIATQQAELSRAKSETQAAKADDIAQHAYAEQLRALRDTAITDGEKKAADLQKSIASINTQLAEAKSSAAVAGIAATNLTAALKASEDARSAQANILDSTRKDNNDLTTRYSQSQMAISDLTNKLEVAQRTLTNSNETVAELTQQKEADESRLKDAGVSLAAPAGIEGGAPPINAVVRSTRMINGIPYATISVGKDAQVVAGMKFQVIDRDKGAYLGELTIQQVDEKEATGKLDGPKISEVHALTEVRTQL